MSTDIKTTQLRLDHHGFTSAFANDGRVHASLWLTDPLSGQPVNFTMTPGQALEFAVSITTAARCAIKDSI